MVSNVIDSIECKDDDVVSQEYKALLVKYKEIISSIFSGASVEGIPHHHPYTLYYQLH